MSPQGSSEKRTVRPLVSVIIPTHNRATMLREAIESVSAQEGIGKLFDLEVIVVDDASTDSTPEVVRSYRSVHYFRLDSNKGASGARNVGIRASSGKYIAFLDDDDLFLPHRLRTQVPLMEAQGNLGVIYGQSRITEDGKLVLDAWPDTGPSGHVFSKFVELTDDFIHPATVLARRDLFDKAGLFDESLPTMEHHDMFLRLAFYAPWLFLRGPVAEGRFSKKGKWFTNVVKRNNERVLPGIVEKALAMLPDIAEYKGVRQKARMAVCTTIINQRWGNGGLQDVRAHLIATIRRYPWMLAKDPIVHHLRNIAREIGRTSSAPLADIAALVDELEETQPEQGLRAWFRRQRVLGDCLAEASIGCRTVSPGMALCTAVLSTVRNPYQMIRLGKKAVQKMHSNRCVQA